MGNFVGMHSQVSSIRYNMSRAKLWLMPAYFLPLWAICTFISVRLARWCVQVSPAEFAHIIHTRTYAPLILCCLMEMGIAYLTMWGLFRALHPGWVEIGPDGIAVNDLNKTNRYVWADVGEAQWVHRKSGGRQLPAEVTVPILSSGTTIVFNQSDYDVDLQKMCTTINNLRR